ncbi:MAG: ABC transporter ATP-binding protein [Candidatus Eisenbacteria bacterium]|uniref:ABC transporter ATP-binding protein n=1 Tax=Eiseniibacteriota bacterium TaxID=2212470 RepID=A0A849SHR7_UNCEI|nr:ABC transporter ATP-binding protein [Candidatus Eisenbacteria bacterium]
MTEPVLTVRDLCVDYITERGPVRAIDRVSLTVQAGEILGVAGESGSGKSTLAQALLRILPPPAVISGGEIRLGDTDVLALTESELQALRWKRCSMVFQSAMDALNPVITIGEQLVDTLQAHTEMRFGQARERAASLLTMVGMTASQLDAYAHQLSGGMRQRVGIALALALEPSLVILDEPTTALDVIVEREILEQLRELQRRLGFSVIFVTHDLGRMLQFSDRVAVFYAARLVEIGPTAILSEAPRHPYTQGLLRAFPSLHGDSADREGIGGAPPSLQNPPAGCRFHPRCPLAMDRCRVERPELLAIAPGHSVACFAAQ